MPTTDPLKSFGTIATPQSQRAPDRLDEVKNNAGGFVFEIEPMAQFRRFLTMGTTGGTYYVGEKELTVENGKMILELAKNPGLHAQAVDILLEISLAGRAPKQNPTLFALAILCQHGSTVANRKYARAQITKVVRTGTHLFIFMGYLKQFGGFSRGLRKAVGAWYTEKNADQLAYQLVKYRQREGWTHRDVLRQVHPKIEEPSKRAAIEWTVKGEKTTVPPMPGLINAFEHVRTSPESTSDVLRYARLPWEALPDSAINDAKVWNRLLDNNMPIHALVRQLPRLTNLEVIPQMGGRTDEVVASLTSPDAVRKSRIHPINVLVALKTYRSGQGFRSEWEPTAKIVDALDEMFYLSFDNVEATGKRMMLALDVSASMCWDGSAGKFPLTAQEVSAAMAMVTVRTEPQHMTTAFSGGGYRASRSSLIDLPLSKRQRLDDVLRTVTDLPHGATNCSLPIIEALHRSLEIDTFVIYTDNETWQGEIHPWQALAQYRKSSGIDAKLVVVACAPTQFSIADPKDPGMLDVSGFDSAVPQLISDFSAGLV